MCLKVFVRKGESIGEALQRFKKSVQIRQKRRSTCRSLLYHEKPGQVRRRKEFMKKRFRRLWNEVCVRAARGEFALP